MDKIVIFIVIVIIGVLVAVWSACVMAARADEQLREITDDKKEPEEKEEEDENVLPVFVKGESGPHVPDLNEKWTQPPIPHVPDLNGNCRKVG